MSCSVGVWSLHVYVVLRPLGLGNSPESSVLSRGCLSPGDIKFQWDQQRSSFMIILARIVSYSKNVPSANESGFCCSPNVLVYPACIFQSSWKGLTWLLLFNIRPVMFCKIHCVVHDVVKSSFLGILVGVRLTETL